MREYREYKEIFDKMPIAMLCVKYSIEENENLKMEIEYANNRMLLLLNSSYEEVVKKDFFDILSEYKEDKEFINIIKNYDGTIFTFDENIQKELLGKKVRLPLGLATGHDSTQDGPVV